MSHTLSNTSTPSRLPISRTTASPRTAHTFSERMAPDATGPSDVIQLRPLSRLAVGPYSGVGADTEEPADIPVLIQKLNRAMAKLPSSGSGTAGEETELPPEYHER